jgi:hypothetical protein
MAVRVFAFVADTALEPVEKTIRNPVDIAQQEELLV